MMRVPMVVILLMMMGLARGDKMTITSVSEDLMVRRGDSVNMTCSTDQVTSSCGDFSQISRSMQYVSKYVLI